MPPCADTLEYLVFSYFFIDIQIMKNWLKGFFSQEHRKEKYSITEGLLDFQMVRLGNPNSGVGEGMVALVYAPKNSPNHCVFISNSGDGWYTLINRMCNELQIKCISIASTQDSVRYPLNSFRVYENGRDIRYVRAMLDGGQWDFFEKGAIQYFESSANYREKRIKNRLSRAVVVDYLGKVGIDIQVDGFWETDEPAFYIHEQRPN